VILHEQPIRLTGRSLVEGVHVMQQMSGFPGEAEKLAKERLTIVKNFFKDGIFRATTNGELSAIVEKILDLSCLFAGNIFSIADVGHIGKPQPDIFLYAAKRLHATVEQFLVIEDTPLGIEAVKRAGMKCIALTKTYRRNSFSFEIKFAFNP
jgi:HAD superfamily hydrolase (TIGR01509 family)